MQLIYMHIENCSVKLIKNMIKWLRRAIPVCEFCLRKMLRRTGVRNPDRKMKEMKVWQFYVVVC